jgi:large subunit ribosomal protein L33
VPAGRLPSPIGPPDAIIAVYPARAGSRTRNPTEGEIMAKGKEARGIIKLKSEASDHCYFTQKNRNNSKERISLRKYDPIVRRHVMYKEASKV